MLLTVEVELKENTATIETIKEVAICCDDKGIDHLIEKLKSLKGQADHLHLMTQSWAGEDLTEQKQGGDDYILAHHLRIVRLG